MKNGNQRDLLLITTYLIPGNPNAVRSPQRGFTLVLLQLLRFENKATIGLNPRKLAV